MPKIKYKPEYGFSINRLTLVSFTNFIAVVCMFAFKDLYYIEFDSRIKLKIYYKECLDGYENIISVLKNNKNKNKTFLSDDQIKSINLALKIASNKQNNKNTAGYGKIMNARMIMENYLEKNKD